MIHLYNNIIAIFFLNLVTFLNLEWERVINFLIATINSNCWHGLLSPLNYTSGYNCTEVVKLEVGERGL